MGYIFRTIKKLFFWGYARNTWQYDVLCALILAFIFLTPQSWFDTGAAMKNWSRGEPAQGSGHQKAVASTVILSVMDNFLASGTQNQIENRPRTITGRTDVSVISARPGPDGNEQIVAQEVDIR